MKTYIVQLPKETTAATEAVVDSILRGFELAINAVSVYRWRNLNLGYSNSYRWFDTNAVTAVSALRDELSNIGIDVVAQPPMVPGEDWDKANGIS